MATLEISTRVHVSFMPGLERTPLEIGGAVGKKEGKKDDKGKKPQSVNDFNRRIH